LKVYIKNILTELPHILQRKAKDILTTVHNSCLKEKSVIQFCDYRLPLIKTTQALKQNVNTKVYELLYSLVIIFKLLYLGEEQQCIRCVLQYANSMYKHALLLQKLISKPHTVALRNLYGTYSHVIIKEG